MAKKRKSVATSLEEVDRTMYSTFCSAANSLSQLYSQAITQQKLTFHAGERHGLEKLYQWILRQQEEGSRVNTMDIISYLQAELDYCGDEPSMSPRVPSLNQLSAQLANSGFLVPDSSAVAPNTNHGSDQQSKNAVFSNALTSPIRRGLQNYHIGQGGQATSGIQASANGFRNSKHNLVQGQDPDSISFDHSSMDMHADSSGPEST